ncbi:MAG: YdcF family protein, partial [Pseudomonadota bacterium]|nr:YdcF family protein [Pseudomonadota bacterium]
MTWTLASKLLPYLIYPFSLGLWLLLIGVVLLLFKRPRSGTVLVALAAFLLVFFSLPKVGAWALSSLERQYPPMAVAEVEQGDLIVTLGGALSLPLAPRLEPDMTGSADRIWHAARLYKAGKAPRVFVAGGNVFPGYHEHGEAAYTSKLLQEWGVPAVDIAFETGSRSTAENAWATKNHLRENGPDKAKVLLVTSAAHMPRALAVFRAAGIDAVPAATDYLVTAPGEPSIFSWLPSLGALDAVAFA